MQALNLDYQADMITNGYLLTEKVVAMLPSLSISSLQITINGMKAVHDSRRCLKLGAPTFDRILQNIDNLKKNQPNVHVTVRALFY